MKSIGFAFIRRVYHSFAQSARRKSLFGWAKSAGRPCCAMAERGLCPLWREEVHEGKALLYIKEASRIMILREVRAERKGKEGEEGCRDI